MSDEETISMDASQMLSAEYNSDGHLQIVEVTMDRDKDECILPDIISPNSNHQKYVQVLDANKRLVQLDLLNLTLVRCEDGEEAYRLVTNPEDGAGIPSDATVTCLLQSSDGGDDEENQDYVMMDGGQGLLLLQDSCEELQDSSHAAAAEPPPPKPVEKPAEKRSKALTPQQILQRAKVLQRTKALMSSQVVRHGKRGRRRLGELPPPLELLSSPSFKLYLYSCKLCSFKCNATKELQAHRVAEHCGQASKCRASATARGDHSAGHQCARCVYRAATHTQLMKHVQIKHIAPTVEAGESVTITHKVSLDTKEVEEADVLVCGACGFESSARDAFREHIESEHGVTAT